MNQIFSCYVYSNHISYICNYAGCGNISISILVLHISMLQMCIASGFSWLLTWLLIVEQRYTILWVGSSTHTNGPLTHKIIALWFDLKEHSVYTFCVLFDSFRKNTLMSNRVCVCVCITGRCWYRRVPGHVVLELLICIVTLVVFGCVWEGCSQLPNR